MVADGLPFHGGAQLAIDTTMVSPLHSNGVAKRGASIKKGLALEAARKRKEMTYPELDKRRRQGQVGSIPKLHNSCSPWLGAKTRDLPEELLRDAAQAWTRRWSKLLNCAAAKTFAQSLLDLVPVLQMGGRILCMTSSVMTASFD